MPKGGKALKGKAKLIGEIDLLKQEEEQKKIRERRRKKTLQIIEDEARMFEENNQKVLTFWREKMRDEKAIELRKGIEVLAQQHDRLTDRYDALLQMFFNDLEEAEQQHTLALQSHMQNVDELITLHDERTNQMEKEYECQGRASNEEFEKEKEDILQGGENFVQEIKAIITAQKKEHELVLEEVHNDFSAKKDDLRNKDTDVQTIEKLTLEKTIDDLKERMREDHDVYSAATEPKLEKYNKLLQHDAEMSKRIDTQMRKLGHLQDTLSSWRTKLYNTVTEGKERNKNVIAEKNRLQKHLAEMKQRGQGRRQNEKRRLNEIVVLSNETITGIKKKTEIGERIIKVAEIARKLEGDEEKIFPFYKSTISGEEERDERDLVESETDRDMGVVRHEGATVLSLDSGIETEYLQPLEGFHKRYNKVLLAVAAIDQEKKTLEQENVQLRRLLKEYIDGISVNEEIMTKQNPLMVIRHAPLQKQGDADHCVSKGIVEGAHIAQYVTQ